MIKYVGIEWGNFKNYSIVAATKRETQNGLIAILFYRKFFDLTYKEGWNGIPFENTFLWQYYIDLISILTLRT